MVQPRYWLEPNARERFKKDIDILLAQYGKQKTIRPAPPPAAAPSRAAAAHHAAGPAAQAEAAAAQAATARPRSMEELLAEIRVVSACIAAAAAANDSLQVQQLAEQLAGLQLRLAASVAAVPQSAPTPPCVPAPSPAPPPPPPAPQLAPIVVEPMLDPNLLRLQADMFAAEMLGRAQQYSDWQQRQQATEKEKQPLLPCATTHLWRSVAAQEAVFDRITEFGKLAHLVLCMPTGSVDNERRFSDVNNIKTDICNRLHPPHLNACMRVACSPFTFRDFPFEAAFAAWNRKG